MKVLILFIAAVVVLGIRARDRTPSGLLLVLCCCTAAAIMTHRFA